jgi:pSer/pThr/pTyr-binding forkhead associated (FHA) protein
MKLTFPNGEHGQVLLSNGPNRIGSAADAAVVLTTTGVETLHCVIHVTQNGANLQIPPGGGPVTVNGRPVQDLLALRAGDTIGIGPVVAKYSLVEVARSFTASSPEQELDQDSGATRVRAAIPKFMLRGVSGAIFGKVFPIQGPMVIGRAAECDIAVQADEISRRHALVKPTLDGISVEDLGSSNGTYINNKRVQTGFLNPGDELRLDAVRFILVAPGMDMSQQNQNRTVARPVVEPRGSNNTAKIVAIIAIAIAAIAIAAMVIFKP